MSALTLVLFAALGFLFGRLYFAALKKNAELYLDSERRGRAVAMPGCSAPPGSSPPPRSPERARSSPPSAGS